MRKDSEGSHLTSPPYPLGKDIISGFTTSLFINFNSDNDDHFFVLLGFSTLNVSRDEFALVLRVVLV